MTVFSLLSQCAFKYSVEVTAYLAYSEGHACLWWSPIILVYCIACIVFAQAVAWGSVWGKCIAFFSPPSLADYLGWHLSINCTYCYTFSCWSSATRLCDEHILSILQHFFFFSSQRFLLQKWLECHSSSMTRLLSQTRDWWFSLQPLFQETFLGKAVSGCSPYPRSVDSRTVVEMQHGPLLPTKPINLPQSGNFYSLLFCMLHFSPMG